ncbi:MAG: hypothetical protein RLZZ230_598 [Candidatus Parcubacteria bacterium]|jgi:cell wall-associated NlpC family hydrolase
MTDNNLEILKYDTYLSIINNSVGSRLFNSFIVRSRETGDTEDILKDGEYACAFFVSSVLTLVQAIDKPTTTESGLERKLTEDNRWFEVTLEEVEAGDVVFYEDTTLMDGSTETHVGFALDDNQAVSISDKLRLVTKHDLRLMPIKKLYRHIW